MERKASVNFWKSWF